LLPPKKNLRALKKKLAETVPPLQSYTRANRDRTGNGPEMARLDNDVEKLDKKVNPSHF